MRKLTIITIMLLAAMAANAQTEPNVCIARTHGRTKQYSKAYVMLNGAEVVILKNKDYTCLSLAAGKYNLAMKLEKELITIPVQVMDGEKYYYLAETGGYWGKLQAIKPVFEAEWKETTEKYDAIKPTL